MNRFLTTSMLLALVWGAVACGSEDAAIYMAEARSAHARFERELVPTDQDTADARLSRAREALESFLAQPVPQSMNEDDARVVRQDMYYRLAELALDQQDAEAAHELSEQGLSEGTARDVFTANLYVVRGAAREALGRDIDAAADYHEALLINDALLQRLLGEGDDQ